MSKKKYKDEISESKLGGLIGMPDYNLDCCNKLILQKVKLLLSDMTKCEYKMKCNCGKKLYINIRKKNKKIHKEPI